MAIILGHLLSVLAVVAYSIVALRYARILRPEQGRWDGAVQSPAIRRIFLLGLLCHGLFLVLESVGNSTADRYPYVLSLISISVAGMFLALERRLQISALGVFIAPLALVFLLVSAVAFHLGGGPSGPFPLTSVLSMHLVFTVLSYALLVVAAGASGAYLVSERSLKKKKQLELSQPFPSLVFLERFHRAVVLIGFGALVLGTITGVAYSRNVGLSTQETLDRLRWVAPVIVLYALLACAIFPLRLRGRKIAWSTILGCFTLVGSLFVSGLITGGVHLP